MSKLVLVSMLFLFSCGGNSKKNFQEDKVSGEFEVIYQNDYTGTPEKSYRVVTNNEDYKAFFMEMKVDEVPEVNFENSNVLILNMGSKTTGGYSVSPEKMTDDGEKLIDIAWVTDVCWNVRSTAARTVSPSRPASDVPRQSSRDHGCTPTTFTTTVSRRVFDSFATQGYDTGDAEDDDRRDRGAHGSRLPGLALGVGDRGAR